MRAQFLGAAGVTELVRCRCGERLYLAVPHWRRRGFTICDECKAVIIYGSLEVVSGEEAEAFMAGAVRREAQRAALREGVERELRHFIQVYDERPEWLWSPETVGMVRAVRPLLESLGGAIGRAGEELRAELRRRERCSGSPAAEAPASETGEAHLDEGQERS